MQTLQIKQISIRQIGFICLVLTCFSGCKKDNRMSFCNNQNAFANYTTVTLPGIKYGYDLPRFNPNNINEFTCIRGQIGTANQAIVTCNIQTGQVNVIYSSTTIWNGPRWSKKDWIAFGSAGNIYKIKSNGDSLIQMTFNGNTFYPDWNYDGTRIVYSLTGHGKDSTIIANENGNIINAVADGGFEMVDWSLPNGLIATGLNYTMHVIDDTSVQETTFTNNNSYFLDICWLDTENILYRTSDGIILFNINTQSKQLIEPACIASTDSAMLIIGGYQTISVSGNRQKILTEVALQEVNTSNKTLESYSEIHLMNIDGSNEIKIKLPLN